jgi:hypothetical protein
LAALQFTQEDSIDCDDLLPKTDQYGEQLSRYRSKDPGSLKILKKNEDASTQSCREDIKVVTNAPRPPQPYIEDIGVTNIAILLPF